MPIKLKEAIQYYAMGFREGIEFVGGRQPAGVPKPRFGEFPETIDPAFRTRKGYDRLTRPKRKLSAWNKFVKANSKKKIYQYANGKLKLKKMGIAFRKKRR